MNKIFDTPDVDAFIDEYIGVTRYDKTKGNLFDFVREFLLSDKKLHFLSTNTASGKTYTVEEVLIEIFPLIEKRAIMTTNKKVNLLNLEKLNERIYIEHGVKDAVVFLDSNLDNIKEKYDLLVQFHLVIEEYSIKVDKDKKVYIDNIKKVLEALIDNLSHYNAIKNTCSSNYLLYLEEKLSEKESEFRKSLSDFARTYKAKTLEEAVNWLIKQEGFSILPQILPCLKIFSAKVVLLTVDKFFCPIDFIVKSFHSFANSPFIDDALIIVDESEDAFLTRKDRIIQENASKHQPYNYFSLIQKVYRTTQANGKLVLPAVNDVNFINECQDDYDEIKNACSFIGSVNYDGDIVDISNYRLINDTQNTNVKIFNSDGAQINIEVIGENEGNIKFKLDKDKKFIELYIDEDDCSGDSHKFVEIANPCFSALKVFKRHLFKLSQKLYKFVNDGNPCFDSDVALSTLLSSFANDADLAKYYCNFFKDEFNQLYSTSDNVKLNMLSNDYMLTSVEPDESVWGESSLRIIHSTNSPEREFAQIIERSKNTLFLSATSKVRSILYNFDIELMCRYLGVDYDDVTSTPNTLLEYKESCEYIQKKYSTTTVFPLRPAPGNSKPALRRKIISDNIESIKKILMSEKFTEKYGIPSQEALNGFINTLMIEYGTSQTSVDDGEKSQKEKSDFNKIRRLNILLSLLVGMTLGIGNACIFATNAKIDKQDMLIHWIETINKRILLGDKKIEYKNFTGLKNGELKAKHKELYYDEQTKSLKNAAFYAIFTTYGTSNAGVTFYKITEYDKIDFSCNLNDVTKNIYPKFPDKARMESAILPQEDFDGNVFIKSDVDLIYFETKTHMIANVSADDTKEDIRIKIHDNLYILNKMCLMDEECKVLTKKQRMKLYRDILSMSKSKPFSPLFEIFCDNRFSDKVAALLRIVLQLIGRKTRNPFGAKESVIFFENGDYLKDLAIMEEYGFDPEITITPDISAIIKYFDDEKEKVKSQIDVGAGKRILYNMLDGLWHGGTSRENLLYRFLKETHIVSQNLTVSEEKLQELRSEYKMIEDYWDILYIADDGNNDGFLYEIDNKEFLFAYWLSSASDAGREFSPQALKLDVINNMFKITGSDFNIHFSSEDKYKLNPVFADIIRGDIGEMCHIAAQYSDKLTHPLEILYELFDYKVKDKNRYIDIKFHNIGEKSMLNFIKDDGQQIIKKLNAVTNNDKTSKALIINFYPSSQKCRLSSITGVQNRVFFIDAVIDDNGDINPQIYKKINDFMEK